MKIGSPCPDNYGMVAGGSLETNKTFIALDLETTGLNQEEDDIIEVAAVKYQGSQVQGIFRSLVNPGRPVPYRIEVLTGIASKELRESPPWPAVRPELAAFLGSDVVVGHNVAFDLAFLARSGLSLTGRVFDTVELASFLLPGLPSYRLATLTEYLAVSSRPRHRALPDAQAAGETFLALLARAYGLGLNLISHINRLGQGWEWPLAPLFQEIERSLRAEGQLPVRTLPRGMARQREAGEALVPAPSPVPLDLEKLASLLEPDSEFARAFPGYERRQGQVNMMQSVARALSDGHHLMVEAGTGIGKSLAYLMPALFYSRENDRPVIISTSTINLQEQLLGKDIPSLIGALGVPAPEVGVVGLKGRSNYLCLRRWQTLLDGPVPLGSLAKLLGRTLVWLNGETAGDRSEINLSAEEAQLWSWVAVPEGNCLGEGCPYRQDGSCFLYRARQDAGQARLIVVNHALLLSDLARDSQVLPPFHHLIVDEAHNLEAEATEQFGFRLSQAQVLQQLGRIWGRGDAAVNSGFAAELEAGLGKGSIAPVRRREIRNLLEDLRRGVEKARGKAGYFFDRLTRFILDNTGEQGEYERRLRITHGRRSQSAWDGVETAAEDLGTALWLVESELGLLYTGLEGLEGIDGYFYWRQELVWLGQACSQLRGRVATVNSLDAETIYWGVCNVQDGVSSWCAAPLSVAGLLEKNLFSERDSVVLTSATLCSQGSFGFIKERLGAEAADEVVVDSPFDYNAAAMIYLPLDFPSPDDPRYQQALGQALVRLCRATGGRALALFTSFASLKAAYADIQQPLAEAGILVLGQGVDGSAKRLLEAFRDNEGAVLLGTASFWEGVDVVGRALSLLVITRLPFSVPTDPVFEARSERCGDAFNDYALPQAVLRFKQGFGRLIRSRQDRGAVVILDSRVHTRRYGKAFLESLPRCTVRRGLVREMAAEVQGWLGLRL